MLRGVPAVAFSGGGVEEIIVNGVTGHVVPSGDTEQLARVVSALLREEKDRKALARAGRKRVQEVFGWNRWVDEWDTVIRNLVTP
jgi:glycosyltransferase involved in cell wall biosynthesis